MPKPTDLTAPIVAARAGFHRDNATRQTGKELQNLAAPKPLANNHSPFPINSMHLENVLGQVQANRANFSHGRLLRWCSRQPILAHKGREGASNPSTLWTIEQLFRTMKTKGFAVEALRQEQDGPLEKLVTAILIAAIKVMQLVAERDGEARRPLDDVLDPDDLPALERVCQTLEGKTAKQKNPHPKGSLAYAAWVFARLGGWTGYYGKPGPIVMIRGLTQFHAIKHGWTLRNV